MYTIYTLLLAFPAAASGGGLDEGAAKLRSGDFAAASATLERVRGAKPRNADYVTYFLAEAEFYSGKTVRARDHYDLVARDRASRFAGVAAWRAADCSWALGERSKAAAAYRRLLAHEPLSGDAAVARFHIAETASGGAARRLFLDIYADFPAHPLAEEARRRAGAAGGLDTLAAVEVSARERLKRAAALADDRHWQEALDELARLPADLPADLAADRDYQIGMTRFRLRHDYAGAAQVLLDVAGRLQGERAASAAFHGARALSRADRDDEAVKAYLAVVQRYPRSRWAAEAQFLAGWLDFNRGRYRDGLGALRTTLERFGRSPFADDAAWYLAFAHHLLGEAPSALAALGEYARLARDEGAARARYWRGRIEDQAGHKEEALTLYKETAARWPLGYYGLLARARLREAGAPFAPVLAGKPPRAPGPPAARIARDPLLTRVDELCAAGLLPEAAFELERGEAALAKRLGGDDALPVLLERYAKAHGFHRAYQLAEARAPGALAAEPTGAARPIWEAAYPRAYAELVERHGPPAGNPDLYLYAIMRKESGFAPLDVSYADARGLLQMIPPTSARVAAQGHEPFFPDQLWEPETNVRLGALYIGSLYRKFGAQIPLAAGAYNAGPRAMTRWVSAHGGRPLDEFVELVAYTQTREYIKRVAAIYAHYRHLYGPDDWLPSLVVDPKVGEGPEY